MWISRDEKNSANCIYLWSEEPIVEHKIYVSRARSTGKYFDITEKTDVKLKPGKLRRVKKIRLEFYEQ